MAVSIRVKAIVAALIFGMDAMWEPELKLQKSSAHAATLRAFFAATLQCHDRTP